MPVAGSGPGGTNQSRQTFRPPWIKDGPPPIPMPTQPWVKSNRSHNPTDSKAEGSSLVTKALRKLSDAAPEDSPSTAPARKSSKITLATSQPKENGMSNDAAPQDPTKNASMNAPQKRSETEKKISDAGAQKPPPKPTERSNKKAEESPRKMEVKAESGNADPRKTRAGLLEKSATKEKVEGLSSKPPAPPMPPPPPPMPVSKPIPGRPLSEGKRQKLEALRSRPKKRPDWGNMMKEIEGGKKLNHIKCNDRSAPLLPKVKAKGQFVYESERPNLHNQLLKQIETGVKLKPTKTNDRSKPFIEGLRKFRRQMTIEEQIQKSASLASLGITEIEPDPLDEVDDIDKVRDDLQSTKQMLALELKNKEALERENKKLLTKILNLEVELEKERNRVNKGQITDSTETQEEIKKLKDNAEKAQKAAEEMENKYHEVNDKLEIMKLDLDEAVQKNQRLEKQLKVAQAANLQHVGQPIAKQFSKKIIHQDKVQESFERDPDDTPDESEEETETETETESEAEGETEEAQQERRLAREIKLLTVKLKSFKDKREAAKKERKALKEQMTKQQKAIKEERRKYKLLQKEVDKMSKLITEEDEEDIEEEEEEEEVEEEEEEEEEEEDTSEEEESEESESEESEGDLPETAPPEKRRINLQNRTKKYENLLSSLKKGNYLLKANVERYKDEFNKQKEMSLTLQEDLNSVLAELG